MVEKSANELLHKKLFLEHQSSWSQLNKNEVFKFAEDYKRFMSKSKTERLCIANIIETLEKNGYKDLANVKTAKIGDKLYKNFKEKAVLAVHVGKNPSRMQLVGSHVDSPRLDLKPLPIYEDVGLGMIKTHYYGGVKKYHWVNLPLMLSGVIFTKSGRKITINLGEKADDPKFIIPDLLPHLARKQMEKKGDELIEGEDLNIIVGNIPIEDEKIKDPIKFAVMKHLHEVYGLVEEDFIVGELELLPAGKPEDIGFDRALVAAYGQDDKVCVYTSLQALITIKNPQHLAVAMFVDKEEIGSSGDTGAASFLLKNFTNDLLSLLGAKMRAAKLLELSNAVSADVTAAIDPNHKEAFDPSNSSVLGRGLSVEKYGGAYGKSYTNDASAEYMQYIRTLLDKKKIQWQTGELGRIDLGGGGTIGVFLARHGMNCLDVGPCVLGMHSPYEVASKADIYSAYQFYQTFLED